MADQSIAIKEGGFTCLEVLLWNEFTVTSSRVIKEERPICQPIY